MTFNEVWTQNTDPFSAKPILKKISKTKMD